MRLMTPLARLLLLFLTLSLCPWAAAEPTQRKITLLTSIDVSKLKPPSWQFWRKSAYQDYEQRLEAQFRKKFTNRGYELEIRHHANQYDLWQALHSPEVIALFWVSHSTSQKGLRLGVQSAKIVDFEGVDVKSVFQETGPTLRFLGVIGCHSREAIQNFMISNEGNPVYPSLNWIAFDRKVEARRGLAKAIRASLPILETAKETKQTRDKSPPQPPSPYKVRIERFSIEGKPARYPSLRIEDWKGRVLGVFPEMGPHQISQTIEIQFALNPISSPAEMQLIATSGSTHLVPDQKVELGDLVFTGCWMGAHWSVFSDANHIPIGVNTRVYEYDGISFEKLNCEPLDSTSRQ